MAKFCSNCGKELDENAAMCLNCGVLVGNDASNNINSTKNEKKKGMPAWAIVLIIVGCFVLIPLILITIIVVTAYNVFKDSGINIEDYIEEMITQEGTIGDTLKTDTFRFTLTDALLYDTIGDENYYLETPREGKEYLVFFLNVENVSSGSEYISSYDFDGYVDGYLISKENIINDINEISELGVDLAPNMKTKGFVAFEVDTTWKEFELHYSDIFDKQLIFTVVNEESSDISGA